VAGCCRVVKEDMALQRVLAKDEDELIAPPGVISGGDVEDNCDKAADVLDSHSLSMQIERGNSLVEEHGVVDVVIVGVARLIAVRRRRQGRMASGGVVFASGALKGSALAGGGGFAILGGGRCFLGLLSVG
jgi:hypothetical protein